MLYTFAVLENNVVRRLISVEPKGNRFDVATKTAKSYLQDGEKIIDVTNVTAFGKSIGSLDTYDETHEIFYPRKENSGWIWSTESNEWVAPTAKPSENHTWDNSTESWVDISGASGTGV